MLTYTPWTNRIGLAHFEVRNTTFFGKEGIIVCNQCMSYCFEYMTYQIAYPTFSDKVTVTIEKFKSKNLSKRCSFFYEEIIFALSAYNLKVSKYSRFNSRLYINRLKKLLIAS